MRFLGKFSRSRCAWLALVCFAGASFVARAEDPIEQKQAPATELTRHVLEGLLMAEIAGARGHADIALTNYVDLAVRLQDARVAQRATEVALALRDFAVARRMAELWLALDPESNTAKELVGRLRTGDAGFGDLEARLAEVLQSSPIHRGDTLMGLSQLLARLPDKVAVKGMVVRLTEPYLDMPEAHFGRGQAAWLAGDSSEALAAVTEALTLQPDWEPAIVLKAQMLQAGSPAAASDLLRDYLTRHGDNDRVRMAFARSLVASNELKGARDVFEDLRTRQPDNPEIIYASAVLSLQLKDYDRAEPLFRRCLQLGKPEADVLRMHLGRLEDARGRPLDAVAWYGQVESATLQAEALIRTAASLEKAGRLAEARELLQSQQGEPEELLQYRLAEGQLLRDAGKVQEAYDFLDEALSEWPDDADLLYETAMLAEHMKRYEIMEGRLRKLMALHPDNAHAYNALGYTLVEQGQRLDEADALLTQALALKPEDPFILDSLGWLRFRQKNLPGALKYLQQAFDARPDPEIAAHLGEVLWLMGRETDARALWQRSVAENPDNAPLREIMRQYLK